MSVQRRIAAFLHLAEQDVEAAETLAPKGNHYADYHCQQAAEKLLKAVLLHRGVEAGIEHQLYALIERLPGEDHWKSDFQPLLKYSSYATAFRYPTPGGRIPTAPDKAEVLQDAAALRLHLIRAKSELV